MYTEKIAEVDQGLFKEDVIAARELDRSNQAKISKEIDVLENETRINSLAIEIETLKQESIGIKSKFDATKLQLENAIKDQLQLLNNGIATWELTYLLKASIDGTCIYKEYLNDYRFVEKEEKVFSLIAQEENQYFALLKLPMQGAGKVQLNQEVYVKLNNYPFMEFGVIKGFITDIAAIPFEANYNVQVNFPNGFISTYGDTLATTPLMLGIGEIIVEKKSLYNRIADQIKSVRLNR